MSESRFMVADVHGLAGSLPELRALLAQLTEASRAEDGCERFRVLGADDDPAGLVVISAWTDEGSLRAHFQTAHYQSYRAAVGPLLARPSDVSVLHVSETVRALDPNPPDPSYFD